MGPVLLKIASIVVPIIGAGASLVGGWLEDKKLDAKVTEKVAEALKEIKK